MTHNSPDTTSTTTLTSCAFKINNSRPLIKIFFVFLHRLWKDTDVRRQTFILTETDGDTQTEKSIHFLPNVSNVSLYLNIFQSDNITIIPGYDLMILPGLWTEKTSQLFSSSPSDTINSLLNRKIIFLNKSPRTCDCNRHNVWENIRFTHSEYLFFKIVALDSLLNNNILFCLMFAQDFFKNTLFIQLRHQTISLIKFIKHTDTCKRLYMKLKKFINRTDEQNWPTGIISIK